MDKPLTLIVGASGTGKSTSIRNLNPKKTAIINTENKALPFPNAKEFEKVTNVETVTQLVSLIRQIGKDKTTEVIIIDSFTSWMENVEAYCQATEKGYEVWNLYNRLIKMLFDELKKTDKFIFITGIHEVLQTEDGETAKRLKTVGRRWEGMIEKEATCVFWARADKVEGEGSEIEIEYVFETQTDGVHSAKTPMDMFKDRKIGNDLNEILKAYKKFYKGSKKKKESFAESVS